MFHSQSMYTSLILSSSVKSTNFLIYQIGHTNIISLTGSRTDADESLRDLTIEKRKCRFSDESEDLKVHRLYSFTSCMFECSLLFAQDELLRTNVITEACVPWFFPPPDDSNVMCDPWETMAFLDLMDRVTDDKYKLIYFSDYKNYISFILLLYINYTRIVSTPITE